MRPFELDAEFVAGRLLDEFGSLAAVLAAPRRRLERCLSEHQDFACYLHDLRTANRHAVRHKLAARPILSNWWTLLEYLRADMAYAAVERIRILHLNSRNWLIKDDLTAIGTIDEVTFHLREIIHSALDLGAAAIIIVHNHPSGDHTPSAADISITRAIADVGRRVGIIVHDHLIISSTGHSSLRSLGLI